MSLNMRRQASAHVRHELRCKQVHASARQPNVRQPRVPTKPRGITRRQGRRARAPARARARGRQNSGSAWTARQAT
eukprot:7752016-Alexandrium_andersonii.AAC.1